jgi:hypothetical protein
LYCTRLRLFAMTVRNYFEHNAAKKALIFAAPIAKQKSVLINNINPL